MWPPFPGRPLFTPLKYPGFLGYTRQVRGKSDFLLRKFRGTRGAMAAPPFAVHMQWIGRVIAVDACGISFLALRHLWLRSGGTCVGAIAPFSHCFKRSPRLNGSQLRGNCHQWKLRKFGRG